MKQIATAAALLGCLLLAAPAWAWTAPDVLSWAAVTGAASYKVEKSADAGITWTTIGTPAVPTLTYNGSDAGLVIYRVSACTLVTAGGACTARNEVGLWHNEAWRPLSAAGSLTTQ